MVDFWGTLGVQRDLFPCQKSEIAQACPQSGIRYSWPCSKRLTLSSLCGLDLLSVYLEGVGTVAVLGGEKLPRQSF